MERGGRRHNQLLDDLKERQRYWKLKVKALHYTPWKIQFGKGYRLVIRRLHDVEDNNSSNNNDG
jgi:hypothetical protein